MSVMVSLALLMVRRVPGRSASKCNNKSICSNDGASGSADMQHVTSSGSDTESPEKLAAARAALQ